MFIRTLVGGMVSASVAAAAPIVTDTFGDNDRTNQALPGSMKWFGGSSTTQLDAGTGKLVIPYIGNNQGGAMAFFADYADRVVLSVGESLTLKFNITTPATGGQTDGNFGMYLLNSGDTRPTGDTTFNNSTVGNDTGYMALSPVVGSSSTRNRIYRRNSGTNNLGSTAGWTQIGVNSPTPNFDPGGTYEYSLIIERTADSEALITSKFVGKVGGVDTTVQTQATDTNMNYILAGFDTIYIWSGNNPSFAIDNVEVTYVPEPASAALLGLCSLLVRRRRTAISN